MGKGGYTQSSSSEYARLKHTLRQAGNYPGNYWPKVQWCAAASLY